jgi:hypothetical protein
MRDHVTRGTDPIEPELVIFADNETLGRKRLNAINGEMDERTTVDSGREVRQPPLADHVFTSTSLSRTVSEVVATALGEAPHTAKTVSDAFVMLQPSVTAALSVYAPRAPGRNITTGPLVAFSGTANADLPPAIVAPGTIESALVEKASEDAKLVGPA